MCGIAGKIAHDPTDVVEHALLERMALALAHRGPDDAGVWASEGAGLASRRLKVIDLSDRAHMPMTADDSGLWITFNGEIYNFRALRTELERRGHRFRSDGDTEVVLRLYQDEGERCLERLRGMFAFAIWDARRRRLFAARDRLGKKPFFYHDGPRAFLFASEPKAILQDPDVASEPDPQALRHYVAYGSVPAPWSAFKGLRKLPPAHYLVHEDGRTRVERYWRLSYQPKRTDDEAALAEELVATLGEAVRLRLISDVPLGALLSGGVDSSAVVALMREQSSGPVRTFSIGFDEPDYDEIGWARKVARHLETEHHELVVRPDAAALLPQLVWHYNEPFADPSAVPTWLLSEMTRRSVTVALGGDGGDESFLGYHRYGGVGVAARVEALPALVRRPLLAGLRRLPTGRSKSWTDRMRRFAREVGRDPAVRYLRWTGTVDAEAAVELFTPEFLRQAPGEPAALVRERWGAADAAGAIETAAAGDVTGYLPDDLLVKMDIASMAHSLEVRSPFLDHEVVEFAARLPVDLKLRGETSKYLLKRALASRLPADVLERRKMGFGVPIEYWLRHELRDFSRDVLLGRRATERGVFEPAAVERLLDEHAAAKPNRHTEIWALLMLELWHQAFIDRRADARPPEPGRGEG